MVNPGASIADAFLASLAAALPAHGFWESPVVVGVSGGGDSVALLLALLEVAPQGCSPLLTVAHAEHDLRAAATTDALFVAALAGRLRLRFATRRLPVRENNAGDGVEAQARQLRYEFLADVARETGARHVVVAHTADDQAETILHRSLRGTGLAGLAGMMPARELCDGVSLLRPLLGVAREQVRGYLRGTGESWCEDETNDDTRYARNFLRHEIIARAEAGPFPAATESLVRLGEQASRAARALASAAEHLLSRHARCQPDGTVTLEATPLVGLDRHLLAEVFVALWRREGWPRRHRTARPAERLADLVAHGLSGRPAAADYPGGIHVRVIDGRLVLGPP
ncbi:MAG: tRNA lysidine(34) synthetase TilS [Planctomycetia bacterium]